MFDKALYVDDVVLLSQVLYDLELYLTGYATCHRLSERLALAIENRTT